jgi:type VI secretion system secreted protein Hcp
MTNRHAVVVRSLLGAALVAGTLDRAVASDAVFILLDTVQGESRDDTHKNWMDLAAVDFAAVAPSSASPSVAGRPVCQPFVVTKKIDKATPKLYEACAKGTHFPTATLNVMRVDRGQLPYLEIKLEDVVVSSVNSTAKSDGPTESVSLQYGKIKYTYRAQNSDGTLDETPVVTSYDCPH